jgi:hypothetical protein
LVAAISAAVLDIAANADAKMVSVSWAASSPAWMASP